MSDMLADVKQLTVDFGSGAKKVRAVDGVDLTLGRGCLLYTSDAADE